MEPLGGATRIVPPPTVLTRGESQEFALGSGLDLPMADTTSREWTDEKHSLYLKSMEASFVNQLYESRLSIQRNRPSGQFKVLQGGSWKKINFAGPEHLNKAGECHVLAADPWIRRLRRGHKPYALVSESPQENAPSKSQPIISNGQTCRSASSSKHFHIRNSHLCHHNSVGGDTEVSDQNFDDDGKGSTPSSGCSSKKMKTLATGAPTKDRVIHSGV